MSDLKEQVRQKYAEAAKGQGTGCRSGSCGCDDPITKDLYEPGQTSDLPAGTVQASLGCGNPTALAELRPGEVVLDLGSGGGIDVLLSAKRVGPTGRAYGLDMTDEMLALARENQRQAGVTNVEFLKGEIENIPLPDASVDVIISNCVINLSGDKPTVLREAFRVLRPRGRFAVADVVTERPLPEAVREDVALWTGCVAGVLTEAEYRTYLRDAGFTGIEIERLRDHEVPGVPDGSVFSAFVRAAKPELVT